MGDPHNLQPHDGCSRDDQVEDCVDHTWGVGSCFYPTMIFTEKLMYNDGIPGDFPQTTCGRSTQSLIPLSPGKKATSRGIKIKSHGAERAVNTFHAICEDKALLNNYWSCLKNPTVVGAGPASSGFLIHSRSYQMVVCCVSTHTLHTI